MAIAFDNAGSFVAISPGTTTASFTVASGGFLVVAGGQYLSAATYAGVSLSSLVSCSSTIIDGNGQTINAYYLANPSSGSNTISVTVPGGANETICYASYTGVYSSGTIPEASNTRFSNNGLNNTQVTSLNQTVTTVTDNAWTLMFGYGGNNSPRVLGAGTGTTARATNNGNGLAGACCILDSGGAVSPAGNSTLEAAWASGVGFVSIAMVSIPAQFPSAGSFIQYFY